MATINPFQPPINYAVDVQSPFEAALGGFKIGAATAEVEAARAARERAQTAQTELTNLFKNPNATSADYTRVAAFLPKDQASMVLQGFEAQTKERQQNALQLGTKVYTAIKSGNPALAQRILQDQADALRNSDREKDAQGYDDLSNIIRLNPTNAQAIIGLNIASLPGGKEFLDSADRALATIRTEAQAPSALTEAKAKADKAVADAERAVAEAKDTPSRLMAEAALKEAQTAQQEALTAASVGGERRAAAKAEDELRELKAKADAAVADAEKKVAEAAGYQDRLNAEQDLRVAQAQKAEVESRVAQATQRFKISEARSIAAIKAAEEKFAPEKFGLEIGLTRAQIEASKAARRASDAAATESGEKAKRAQAEASQIAAGIIPIEKRPEAETKFRTEYNAQTKPFQEVKSAYGRVLSSEDTAVGDLSLIFGYMKMLDPGSVVREGEFATAQNATGVPERIQNIYNKVVSGERLNASQRNSFKGQAKKLYESAGEQETVVRQGLERIAKGYGLNTANIFYTPVEVAPTARSSTSANTVTVGGRTYTRPANFTDAQWNSYKQSVGAQ
jgi:hypothetical protein